MGNWSPLSSHESGSDMAERLLVSVEEAAKVVVAIRNTRVLIQNTYINARGDGEAVVLVDLAGESSLGVRLDDIEELRKAINAHFAEPSRWIRKIEIYGKRRVVIG